MGIKQVSLLSNRKNKLRLFNVDAPDRSLTSIRARCDVTAEARGRAALVWHPFPPGMLPSLPPPVLSPSTFLVPTRRDSAQEARARRHDIRTSRFDDKEFWYYKMLSEATRT